MKSITLSYPVHEYESALKALLKANQDTNIYINEGWKMIDKIKYLPDRWIYVSVNGTSTPVFEAEEYTVELSLDNPLKREALACG